MGLLAQGHIGQENRCTPGLGPFTANGRIREWVHPAPVRVPGAWRGDGTAGVSGPQGVSPGLQAEDWRWGPWEEKEQVRIVQNHSRLRRGQRPGCRVQLGREPSSSSLGCPCLSPFPPKIEERVLNAPCVLLSHRLKALAATGRKSAKEAAEW